MRTKLHTYSFGGNCREYKELCKRLQRMGLKKFRVVPMYTDLIREDCVVELETEYLFDNQWNSPIGRIYDWFEVYVDSEWKCGYWLEQTAEMLEERSRRYRCRYCGTQYVLPEFSWCRRCVDSKYLKESDLHLTHIVCVMNQNPEVVEVPESIRKRYHTAQRDRRIAERNKKICEIKSNLMDLRHWLNGRGSTEDAKEAMRKLIYQDNDILLESI